MANWALVILTLGLVIVTFLYMRHTKRMADIMAREWERKETPLLYCERQPGWVPPAGRRLGMMRVEICNAGPTPVPLCSVGLELSSTDHDQGSGPPEIDATMTLGPGKCRQFQIPTGQLRREQVKHIYVKYRDRDGNLQKKVLY